MNIKKIFGVISEGVSEQIGELFIIINYLISATATATEFVTSRVVCGLNPLHVPAG